MTDLRVLCLGDVVGKSGRSALKICLEELRRELCIDLVIVNGENASGGIGLEFNQALELHRIGVDIITLGDHSWKKGLMNDKEKLSQIEAFCVRPANFLGEHPGKGWLKFSLAEGLQIGVFNLEGRVFMNHPVDCPFTAADQILANELADCTVRICDFHAEATSEKVGLGQYLDGRVSLIFGTHTHIQTADEQILPAGTGYITDLGMCGAKDGIIGMDKDMALRRLKDPTLKGYKIAKGDSRISGVVVEINRENGRCTKIDRISRDVQGT